MKISITDFKRKSIMKKPIQVEEPIPITRVKNINLEEEEYMLNIQKEPTKQELDYIDFIQSKYPTRTELFVNRIAKINPLIKDLVERLSLRIEGEIIIVNTINKVI